MAKKVKAYGICLYKKERETTKILMCKAKDSKKRWGFLKGVTADFETKRETAIREFFEECCIEIEENQLENYFEQCNSSKDIGVFLVNFDKINGVRKFFCKNQLFKRYLSPENKKVRFFETKRLPFIKKKQAALTKEIVKFLNKDN